MDKYICKVCANIYEPEIGDSEGGIPSGTPFSELPENWICPVCASAKDKYELLTQERYEQLEQIIHKY